MRMLFKRLALCFCLLFTCYSLSGCALLTALATYGSFEDAVKQMQEGSALDSLQKQVADNNRFAQSKKTSDLGKKALDKQTAADNPEWYERINILGLKPFSFITAAKSIEAKKAVDAYTNACASDKTLIKSREAAGKPALASNWSLKDIPTVFLVIGAILILLFLMGFLKKQKAETKAIKKAAKKGNFQVAIQPQVVAPQQQDAPPSPPVNPDVNQSGYVKAEFKQVKMNPEKQAALAQRKCAELGLNYEEMLAQYGGDPIALNVALTTM